MAQISVNNLTFYYEGSFDNIFENVSFSIDTNWKLGFVGRNGKGKTTFLNLLLGKYEYVGSISTNVIFDYFPYQVKSENLELPAIAFIDELKPGCDDWRVLCELDKLNVDAEVLYRPFKTLSFGERTKVMLAIFPHGGKIKAEKMQSRVKQMENRIEHEIDEKEGLLQDIERTVDLKLEPLKHHKEVLVSVRNYGLRYPDSDSFLFENLDFEIRQGERVFLNGENGCGKSSLIKTILTRAANKEIIPQAFDIIENGEMQTASGMNISYINQDTAFLKGSIKDFCVYRNLDESFFCALLHQMGMERAQFVKPMEDYSEGQKKKILIAASLLTPAHLYIWDEPLNYIDVFSRMQIEKIFETFEPTMLIVEHDVRFREEIATKIINI